MMVNPVGWFEIYVNDMARARGFYEQVFQCSLEQMDNPFMEMWAFPMESGIPGAAGALTHMPGVEAGGNSVLIYLQCNDCADEAARVEDAGGKVVREKMSIGEHGFIVIINDSEGNVVGLHSMA